MTHDSFSFFLFSSLLNHPEIAHHAGLHVLDDVTVIVPIPRADAFSGFDNERGAADRADVDSVRSAGRARYSRLDPAVAVKEEGVSRCADHDQMKADVRAVPRSERRIGPKRDLLAGLDDMIELLAP